MSNLREIKDRLVFVPLEIIIVARAIITVCQYLLQRRYLVDTNSGMVSRFCGESICADSNLNISNSMHEGSC